MRKQAEESTAVVTALRQATGPHAVCRRVRGDVAYTAGVVFDDTETEVTDNDKGRLNGRRLAEFAYALPRTRWHIGLTQPVRWAVRPWAVLRNRHCRT